MMFPAGKRAEPRRTADGNTHSAKWPQAGKGEPARRPLSLLFRFCFQGSDRFLILAQERENVKGNTDHRLGTLGWIIQYLVL